ncbi:hypothetical protein LTR53_017229, partial [Teratosphaeriaceae sp. CCFEE 6253]
MPSAIARKKYGTDINRYLGVEFPEDHIHVPEQASTKPRPNAHRNASSAFSIRDSFAKMFSPNAHHAPAAATRKTGASSSMRRWKNGSTSSALAPATPLKDRTN